MKHIATVPAALVKAAMLFQANQDVRRYLNGIYITRDHIVATDGHTLFVSPYESELRPEQPMIVAIKGKISPKAHNLELLYDEESKIGVVRCVGPTPISTLVRSGTSWVPEDPKPMAILDKTVHPEKVFFDKIDGRFPDWLRVVPHGDLVPTDRIGIDFGYAERVAKACKELGSKFAQCSVKLRGPETSVEIDLKCRDYPGAIAIIMPCRM